MTMKQKKNVIANLIVGAALMQAAPSALAAKPSPGWESAAGKSDEMVFALTGDSIINRRISVQAVPGGDDLYGVIRGADVAFTNFETLIHGFTEAPAVHSGGTYMGSPPFITDELKWAGFDLLGAANNHANDYGVEGMRKTMEALDKTDFTYAGIGENLALARSPKYHDTSKGRVALIGLSSSFPDEIAAGAQRKDIRGRPGLNPLHHDTTHTVPQATFDTLKQLKGPVGGVTMGMTETKFKFGEDYFTVGEKVGTSTKANERDLKELVASVKDANKMADWVVVSIHAHEGIVGDRSKPAEFVEEFAHAMIDAGADMVVGHGPHILRGIEIYKGKPIFYSLGNFIFENDLVEFQPSDNYEKTGLSSDMLPGDYFAGRTKNDTVGFPADRKFWQTVVPEVIYSKDRTLKSIRLHPVALGYGTSRAKRGQPYPATPKDVEEIFGDLKALCEPYGTSIAVKNGVGTLSWK
jgi:poly-gamma-glutamate capsule biosynthesis protein CapA/YwtB (metallophosphatase superfamily)